MKLEQHPDLSYSMADSGRFLEILYLCPGRCKFFLSETMPPAADAVCIFLQNGGCLCKEAQIAAMNAGKQRVSENLKELEEWDGE